MKFYVLTGIPWCDAIVDPSPVIDNLEALSLLFSLSHWQINDFLRLKTEPRLHSQCCPAQLSNTLSHRLTDQLARMREFIIWKKSFMIYCFSTQILFLMLEELKEVDFFECQSCVSYWKISERLSDFYKLLNRKYFSGIQSF